MKINKRLILIPTYNELENSKRLCKALLSLGMKHTDILFIDDNSPDGTGKLLDKISKKSKKVHVIHRSGKNGIGSAHLSGILWAYKYKYNELVTMDCDFTHSPSDIPKLINNSKDYDVVVGSRYLNKNSLAGWNFYRKALTQFGHLFTEFFLRMDYDASNAFRLYKLDNISEDFFKLTKSKSYSFFLESLFILNFNGFEIGQISMKLPPRTYGHSKMKFKDVFSSIRLIIALYIRSLKDRKSLKLVKTNKNGGSSKEINYWEEYWLGDALHGKRFLYDFVASFYRRFLIKPTFNHIITANFRKKAKVLHAGCGGGEVDMDMQKYLNVTALDFSENALKKYQKLNGRKTKTVLGDIRHLPFKNSTFDGIYNLGVMEHFTEKDIKKIFIEFKRVLKKGGRTVIFWPPEYGVSVIFFKILVFVFKDILGNKKITFHPPELTRLKSKKYAINLFTTCGFKVRDYLFGINDAFTYAVIVAEKK